MNKKSKIVAGVVAAVILTGGALGTGYALGVAGAGAEPRAQARCNLAFPQGVVPAIADESSIDARIANPACSNGQILLWQEQQRAAGLSDRVCVPTVIDPLTGTPIICTAPVEVHVEHR